jgi:hypothetical protein
MYEMFTPATAKGYSHVARVPCCFSINLLKEACLIVGSATSNRQSAYMHDKLGGHFAHFLRRTSFIFLKRNKGSMNPDPHPLG